jgi:Mg2+ and Co2+ transporter CorA
MIILTILGVAVLPIAVFVIAWGVNINSSTGSTVPSLE